jgi:hypothetical protein
MNQQDMGGSIGGYFAVGLLSWHPSKLENKVNHEELHSV